MKDKLVRMMIGAAMAVALMLGLAPGALAVADAELIVHHRLCGENYTGGDPFVECHDVLVGGSYEFFIEGPVNQTQATDAATGNATFTGLLPGTYHLYGGVPGEFSDQVVYCVDQTTGEALTVTAGTIGVNVEIPEGISAVCDVYEHPIDQSGGGNSELIIHHRLCGENYKGGDPFLECHDVLVGTAFEFFIEGPVNQTQTTDVQTGNATFSNLPAGAYHLYGGVPGEFSDQVVYCADQDSGAAVMVTEGTIGVNVEIPADSSIVCDVYEHPVDLGGGDPKPTPTPKPKPEEPKKPSDDVTQLPNTGAGGPADQSVTFALIASTALLSLGGLALVIRRRLVAR